MKKLIVLIIAAIMVVTTLTGAFANAALFDQEPKRVSEGVCAIGGGVVGGLIGHHLIGKDPVTAVLALIGGVIGYDYCKNYVNNPRYQSFVQLQDSISKGFARQPGPRSFTAESDDFLAGISILSYGEKSGILNSSKCVLFEATVYRKGRTSREDALMGKIQRVWACETQSGEYQIVRNSQGIREVRFPSESQSSMDGSRSSGSSVGTFARLSRNWRKLDYSQFSPRTKVKKLKTNPVTGKDEIVESSPFLMNRAGEKGFFAGREMIQDGYYGIKMAIDVALVDSKYNYAPPVYERDVAIECNELNYCQAFQVRNVEFDGVILNGTAQYIFPNGDMIVDDSKNGFYIVPGHLL